MLVFQSRPLLPHGWMLAAQPFAIVGIIALLADSDSSLLLLNLAAHLLAFFGQRRDRLFWAVAAALGLALLIPGLVFGWLPRADTSNAVLTPSSR